MATNTALVKNDQASLHIEPLDASMPRQSEMLNKISPEVWQTIFSFLPIGDVLPASLTCRHWKVQIESNSFWRTFFKNKVYFVKELSFPSWRVAALNYAHKKERVKSETSSHKEVDFLRWGKEINPLGDAISYEEDNLHFNGFLERDRMLVATRKGVKVLKLTENQITEACPIEMSGYSYQGLSEKIRYHRYLVSVDYKPASLESIDLNNPKLRFTWNLSNAPLKIKESGNNTIISLKKDQEVICYNLETGVQTPLLNEKLHMWKSISKELLLLIFNNGLVQIRNLTNGSSVTINEPIENGNIIRADFARNYVVLFYENATHLAFTAKFINLENGQTYLIEKERDNLQCVDCYYSEETNRLILSYGKPRQKYKVVDLKTKEIPHQFQLNTPCSQWIVCSDSYFLYIDQSGAFKLYKIEQKTVTSLGSKKERETTFVRKETFGNNILIWVDEECEVSNPYYDDDDDDVETVLKLRCYVFNPESLTLDPIKKGSVYTNERNCFVATSSGNHFLFNKETSTVILCSDNDDELSVFYNKVTKQVIVGESFGNYNFGSDDDYDDDDEPKTFSLEIYDIEKGAYVTLVGNGEGRYSLTEETSLRERLSKRLFSRMQGQVSQIYTVGSKICIFVYSWDRSGKSSLIEIDQNLVVTKTELAKGADWNHFIDGKRLVVVKGALHSFNIGNSGIDPLLNNHPKVELLEDRVLIASKGSIDLFRL